jgi:hypothetical protein
MVLQPSSATVAKVSCGIATFLCKQWLRFLVLIRPYYNLLFQPSFWPPELLSSTSVFEDDPRVIADLPYGVVT